jgi:hypothetical protein
MTTGLWWPRWPGTVRELLMASPNGPISKHSSIERETAGMRLYGSIPYQTNAPVLSLKLSHVMPENIADDAQGHVLIPLS